MAGLAFLEHLFARFDQFGVQRGDDNRFFRHSSLFFCRSRSGCGLFCVFFGRDIQNCGTHGDFNAVLAIGHARFTRKLCQFGFGTVVNNKPVGVGHFDVQKGFVGQHEIVIDQIVGIQDIGHNRVYFVRFQRLGIAKRH